MRQQMQTTTESPDVSPELSLELKQLSNKDLELWSILVLIGVVVTIGFLTLIAPNVVWRSGPVAVDSHLLPQLFSGFIVLVALVNIYLFDQKHRVNQTRDRLIRKLMSEQSSSNSELCDPQTKLFSRNYVELLVPKETARADREGRCIGFGFLTISNLKGVAGKFGNVAAEHLLLVFAQLLKTTLRGSDILSRHSKDEFLVLLPDTPSPQARRALERVLDAVENWNRTTTFPYKLEVQAGCSSYAKGHSVDEVVLTAKHNIGILHANCPTGMPSVLVTAIQ